MVVEGMQRLPLLVAEACWWLPFLSIATRGSTTAFLLPPELVSQPRGQVLDGMVQGGEEHGRQVGRGADLNFQKCYWAGSTDIS